jgi:hypothetical protein
MVRTVATDTAGGDEKIPWRFRTFNARLPQAFPTQKQFFQVFIPKIT